MRAHPPREMASAVGVGETSLSGCGMNGREACDPVGLAGTEIARLVSFAIACECRRAGLF